MWRIDSGLAASGNGILKRGKRGKRVRGPLPADESGDDRRHLTGIGRGSMEVQRVEAYMDSGRSQCQCFVFFIKADSINENLPGSLV